MKKKIINLLLNIIKSYTEKNVKNEYVRIRALTRIEDVRYWIVKRKED